MLTLTVKSLPPETNIERSSTNCTLVITSLCAFMLAVKENKKLGFVHKQLEVIYRLGGYEQN